MIRRITVPLALVAFPCLLSAQDKLADLVVLDTNPLENLRNTLDIHPVILNGRIRDGDTLDEVWPRQQSVGPFYWQNEPSIPETAAGIGN